MTRRRLSSAAIRVRALWRQNPCCHWCGRPTRLLRPPSSSANVEEASPALFNPPLPIGTVDHLYSHYHPRRGRKKHAGSATVLACKECNAERCRKENLVFRDFVRTLARLGLVPETNRRKLLAFRTALATLESPEVLPEKLDGQDLAMRFVRRADIERGSRGGELSAVRDIQQS